MDAAYARGRGIPAARWLLAGLVLMGALLLGEAVRQFATPVQPRPLEVTLTLSPGQYVQLHSLSNGAQIWLVRQPDMSMRAFSARSPWSAGGPVRLLSDAETADRAPSLLFTDGWTLFHRDGTPDVGPAIRGLDRFELRQHSRDTVVLIDASHVILGECVTETGTASRYCSTTGHPVRERARVPQQAR